MRWLNKNFDIRPAESALGVQGVVIFQVQDHTYGMSSAWKIVTMQWVGLFTTPPKMLWYILLNHTQQIIKKF